MKQRTPERTALLRDLWQVVPPIPRDELLDRLNALPGDKIQYVTLNTWARSLGLKRRTFSKTDRRTPGREALLRELWPISSGVPVREITRRLNALDGAPILRDAVRVWAASLNLPTRTARIPAVQTAREPREAPMMIAPMDTEVSEACAATWSTIREWGLTNRVPMQGAPDEMLRAVNIRRRNEGLPGFTPVPDRGPEAPFPSLATNKNGFVIVGKSV